MEGSNNTNNNEDAVNSSRKWANDLRLDMLAATLLDPNLICFRSVATDQHEALVITDLMNQMSQQYVPRPVPDLLKFLTTLMNNTMKP